MSTLEDEILDHFEAEPLARFVYAQHEGQCYYKFMGGKQEYTRKSMTLSRHFWFKRYKGTKKSFEVAKGVCHRSNTQL